MTAARVVDIVLNTDSLLAQKIAGIDGHGAVGTIACEIVGEENEQYDAYIYARPLNDHIKYYPLKNEIVILIKTVSRLIYKENNKPEWYYMCNINIWGNQNHNSLPLHSKLEMLRESATQTYLDNFVSQNSSEESNEDPNSDLEIDHGFYFKEQNTIKPLLPYEGDYILEGRFGNSIRMGSTVDNSLLKPSEQNMWSSDSSIGEPITIISNGMSKDPKIYQNNPNKIETDAVDKPWIHTVEDINNDPSSIYLTSNQKIINFQPAGVGHRSMIADSLEESSTIDSLTSATSYIEHPKLSNDLLPTNNKEDVYLKPAKVPNLEEENAKESALIDLSQKYSSLLEDNTNNENPIPGSFIEETPFYIIEGTTDTNNLSFGSDPEALFDNNNATTQVTTNEDGNFQENIDFGMSIGSYFKLIHLISSPKSSNLDYTNVNSQHPGAIFTRDTLGFYVEIDDNGRKKIITKDFIGIASEGNQYHPTSSYNIISNIPQIDPIDQSILEEGSFTYSKTDVELIREAESNLFGNYSSYGINNYPGIDPSISATTIITNLEKLFVNVIDPLIEAGYGVNIVSAYRSKALNKTLERNPSNSEHIYGYAVDIRDPSGGNNQGLFNYINDNLEFTKLMWAFPEKEEHSWIHVSYIEGKLFKTTTLASEKDQFHNLYKGIRRGMNKYYQDNITKAINISI